MILLRKKNKVKYSKDRKASEKRVVLLLISDMSCRAQNSHKLLTFKLEVLYLALLHSGF